MTKQVINHSCGHQVTHNLIGKYNDRDRKAAWLANHVCSDCYKAQLAAERAKANFSAAETAKEQQLPALIGSDKQVAWATTIRQDVLEHVTREILKAIKKPIEEAPAEGQAFFKWLKDQKESKFWIDNRMHMSTEHYATLFVNSTK